VWQRAKIEPVLAKVSDAVVKIEDAERVINRAFADQSVNELTRQQVVAKLNRVEDERRKVNCQYLRANFEAVSSTPRWRL
jgi:hypothetical protein